MRHGTIVFVELPVRDLARAADFYAGLFGWSFEEDPSNPRRWVFAPPGTGAMGAISTERPAGPGGAKIAVAVQDAQATAQRAIDLGGGPGESVTTDIATYVDIVDPDGNHVWAFQGSLSRAQV
jgi:predicted enzyme related to lactoylglutathione lyase